MKLFALLIGFVLHPHHWWNFDEIFPKYVDKKFECNFSLGLKDVFVEMRKVEIIFF